MHTVEGQRLLNRVGGIMKDVGHVVRGSHERWDGSGYPDGLAGEDIPLESRIVCCCDAFNAMTTDRSYRAALSTEVAIVELRANAGTQFTRRWLMRCSTSLRHKSRCLRPLSADAAFGHLLPTRTPAELAPAMGT
jgi:HD-GYP domain-containing protein (c-di-GMP phosphodiesterase class II)